MDSVCVLVMEGAILCVAGIALLNMYRDLQIGATPLPELIVQGTLSGLLVLLLFDYCFHYQFLDWSIKKKRPQSHANTPTNPPHNTWSSSSRSPTS